MSQPRQVKIVFNKKVYDVELDQNSSYDSLTQQIHTQTEIPPQHQKLIFKGKILNGKFDLNSIPKNQKLMLMYTSTSANDGNRPIVGQVALAREALALKNQQLKEKNAKKPQVLTNSEKEQQFQMWKLTGIINLKNRQLKNISTEEEQKICELQSKVKIVDLSENQFSQIPAILSQLSQLQRLKLSQNQIYEQHPDLDEKIVFDSLQILYLDNNLFQYIPIWLLRIKSLKRLDFSNNQLKGGILSHDQLGQFELVNLEEFKISQNQLKSLEGLEKLAPNLQYFDAANNKIEVLHDGLSEMKMLKVMILNSNKISNVPSKILVECSKLSRLELHANNITMQQLREQEGFDQLESRRQAHYDKKIDMDVLGFQGFDEGLDYE
eukprot:TRINITY_DN4907_c0_g1_i6.p2 TRINITY_DN4907_c0_g1~~TRINITY_DN4907_c0_g1_i6.p2  ORF type:complete len:380 (-),score=42.22 TRINITY_DN4907_c0_g1_i6:151-1290(-)